MSDFYGFDPTALNPQMGQFGGNWGSPAFPTPPGLLGAGLSPGQEQGAPIQANTGQGQFANAPPQFAQPAMPEQMAQPMPPIQAAPPRQGLLGTDEQRKGVNDLAAQMQKAGAMQPAKPQFAQGGQPHVPQGIPLPVLYALMQKGPTNGFA